jgi:hypothetical protein
MKSSLVIGAAVLAACAAAPLLAQAQPGGPAAPSPRAGVPPCPGMGGLEIGQTRTFSFERMARLEPAKQTVTRDLKVVHHPENRPWIITVTYDSDSADAKVNGLYYLIDPPSDLRNALVERYGAGAPLPTDPTTTLWDLTYCQGSGVRLRYRSRLNEKQKPIEEFWVEPIPAKSVTQQKKKG